MINIYKLIIILIFSSQVSATSQELWHKITVNKNAQINDVALDSLGNFYLSIKGYEELYKGSLLDDSINFNLLPRVQDRTFFIYQNQVKLMIDTNNHLLALYGIGGDFIPYRLGQNGFEYDNFTDPTDVTIIPGSTIANEEGTYFINYLSEVYKLNTKWKINSSTKVFSTTNSNEIIFKIFPYNDSTNYAFVEEFNNQKIFKFNSKSLNSEKILLTSSILNNPLNVEVTKNGDIYFPTISGLYHYYPDLISLEIPVIDSTKGYNSNITDFRLSKKKDILIARTNSYYFFSYDQGTTWIKPLAFNKSFPRGTISKLEVYDSIRAILQINDSCNNNLCFILHPKHRMWIVPEVNRQYWNYTDILKSKAGNLYAKLDNCNYKYSLNEGKDWQNLLINGENVENLLINQNDDIISYFKKDSVLYLSQNNSFIWTPVFSTMGQIINLSFLHDTSFFLISERRKLNQATEYYFYYSMDGCKTWELTYNGEYVIPNNTKFKWDPSGKMLALTGKKVLFSINHGASWSEDVRFLNIDVQNINFLGKDLAILDAKINNKRWTYSTTDFINFAEVDAGFHGKLSYPLSYITDNELLGLFSETEGLKISKDKGKTWREVSTGIPIDTSIRYTAFNSICISDNNASYISLAYDGIYKCAEPLLNSVKINNSINNNDYSICPNPFKESLFIESTISNDNSTYNIKIINLYGLILMEKNLSGRNVKLDVRSLPAGIYFAYLENGLKPVEVRKLIKY
ncbi:MAG: T9SS type A sorting domain-containing protein [Saprospiraceae bacterium]|nr:T9SS type A sorting domain-containing protein [Saprospiraceae bacterium]HNA65432.1 T9SS type A sorting domain-containing protein [Saprospiraceae bacterium]HNG70229.1 T9SS type A sorting domain-containing protein [Saprospiraceae bacterium]HNL05530.1 T9SS type A sorting domain-containing protein [Bacteroidia bacterium]